MAPAPDFYGASTRIVHVDLRKLYASLWKVKQTAQEVDKGDVSRSNAHPLHLKALGGGRYYVIDGNHRVLEALLAGRKTLPARIGYPGPVPGGVSDLARHADAVVSTKGSGPTPTRGQSSGRSGGQTILKGEVYHVGNLPKRPSPSKRPRAGTSYEGAGLSVSEVPSAWRAIARLGGLALYALERVDGREGKFVDLTGDRVHKYARLAVQHGWVRSVELYRVWTTDEDEEEQYVEFDNLRSAEVEAESYEGEARIERVTGFAPTDKLLGRWRKDFTGVLGTLSALVLNIAVLYMLDETSDVDGAWWNEDLDVDRLSAPRGVIFPSRLQHWQAHKIPWSEAPDADERGRTSGRSSSKAGRVSKAGRSSGASKRRAGRAGRADGSARASGMTVVADEGISQAVAMQAKDALEREILLRGENALAHAAARYVARLVKVRDERASALYEFKIQAKGGRRVKDDSGRERSSVFPVPTSARGQDPHDFYKQIPAEEGLAYRGMSWEAWQHAQRVGSIASSGEMNLGEEQVGLTFYAPDPETATSYGGSFSGWHYLPAHGRPGVVVAVPRKGLLSHQDAPKAVPSGELAARSPIPLSEVRRVWFLVPYEIRDGKLEVEEDKYTGKVRDGSRSSPSSYCFIVPGRVPKR